MSSTFHDLMRVRLLALASLKGVALSALSRAMGKNHAHLTRKLDPSEGGEARILTTRDIDDALAALGETAQVLMAPVVGLQDRAILSWVDACPTPPTEADAMRFMRSAKEALTRLVTQELVASDSGVLSLTTEGRRLLAAR